MNFTDHTFKKNGAWIEEYSSGGTCQAIWKILDKKPHDGKYRVIGSDSYKRMQRAKSDSAYNDYYHNKSSYIPENIVSV